MITRTFQQPANKYTEEVNAISAFIGAALIPPIYFALCGVWGAAIAMFLVNLALFSAGTVGIAAALFINVLVAFGASSMIANSYLRKGWVEITDQVNSQPKDTSDKSYLIPIFVFGSPVVFIIYAMIKNAMLR